ncbi:MAG: integrin alpha, partial [Cyanobium sp.]
FQAEEWETDRLLLFGDELDPPFGSMDAGKTGKDSDGYRSDKVQILLNHSWLDTASAADIGALLDAWISANLSARSSALPDASEDERGDERSDLLPSDQEGSKEEDNSVSRSAISLELLAIANGSGGFLINGQKAGDNSGWSVAGVGDVNGDGLGDVLIGAPKAEPSNLINDAGRSYVVFGKTGSASTTAVNLSAIANGIGGFVINGTNSQDISGTSVAAAGDVNGDGLADLLVGAPKSDPTSGMNAGRSYVVFGKTTTTAIQLSGIAAGNGGFVINGQSSNEQTGFSVSSAGDINGDGLADLLIGAPYSDPATGVDVGKAYVIFGKSSHITSIPPLSPIELASLSASDGFAITGQANTQLTGLSVASAGDVNGDGFADLIIGGVNPNMLPFVEGYAYVVYGAPNLTSINLSSITSGVGGFRIKDRWNASIGTSLGISVAGA